MKAIVVANWKMNPRTMKEAKELFVATRKMAGRAPHISLVVAVPSVFLPTLASTYKGGEIVLAAQNTHFEDAGAHTGEVSPVQIKDAGAGAVLVGHAERRAMGEVNELINAKVKAAVARRLQVVLCVGETIRDGSAEHFNIIKEQLRIGLQDIPAAQLSRIVIAYEPVWAIGTEDAMGAEQMHEMAIYIRKALVASHGEKGMQTKILYGGSINENNAKHMMEQGDVDGLLVGHVSVNAKEFAVLIRSLA